MPNVKQETPKAIHNSNVSHKRLNATGLCASCGHKITLCGRPFTADIECCKCHVINHFRTSQQPTSFTAKEI